jgi:hypothetical protein
MQESENPYPAYSAVAGVLRCMQLMVLGTLLCNLLIERLPIHRDFKVSCCLDKWTECVNHCVGVLAQRRGRLSRSRPGSASLPRRRRMARQRSPRRTSSPAPGRPAPPGVREHLRHTTLAPVNAACLCMARGIECSQPACTLHAARMQAAVLRWLLLCCVSGSACRRPLP